MDLLSSLAIQPHGDRIIEKMVKEAEEVFLKAYFEMEIEGKKKANKV